jgi:hypothetical protein
MNKSVKTLLTLALLAAFGGAAYFSFSKTAQIADTPAGKLLGTAQVVNLTGLISLDVEPYFKDPRVIKLLADNKVTVNLTRMGSRDMAARVVPGTGQAGGSAAGQTPDFFFPSGVVAANQIGDAAKTAKLSATVYSPFYTPMVIASWTPIAQILATNGLATSTQPRVWALDMVKLTQAMLDKKRWKDLKGAQAYEVNKSVLVSTTDVRKSNSAAMYLALTSYAINGGDIVSDLATAQKIAPRAAELFKRQGYQENYVNGNFDDYASIGMGKTPLAFIYENQLVSYALAKKGVGADMVLMYPQPTIFNKVVFVAISEASKRMGELLTQNTELQRIAVDYGFRIADSAYFAQTVKATGLAIEERITQIIDPPSFEVMGAMIEGISKEMGQ